jgi:hypothetical protein
VVAIGAGQPVAIAARERQVYRYCKPIGAVHWILQVADALDQPFKDSQFDLVWSLESGEHMPDKQ